MRFLTTALATLTLAAIGATQTLPCWETNFGNNLGLGDDAYALGQVLGFNFTFAGVTYTDITICSNGYIWPGPIAPGGLVPDYTPTVVELQTQGPRLAPLWMDFNPAEIGSGNVWLNTIAAGGGLPARAVITWDNVFEYGRATPLSMQVTLVDNGDVIVAYGANMSIVNGGFGANNHVVGSSNGTGTVNPVNFSVLPIVTAGNPTMHQEILRGPFPLVGKNLQWIADGAGGWVVVARTQCGAGSFLPYGVGCPKNMTAYELFSNAAPFDLSNQSLLFVAGGGGGYTVVPGPGIDNNYSNVIVIGDDQVIAGQPLGFSFPFAGAPRTTADIASNGLWWMGSTASANRASGYPGLNTATTEPNPSIAVCWQDLDPSAGGTVYFDTGAGYAMMTWVGVPYWAVAGSSNTCQLKVLANGNIVMSWGACSQQAGGNLLVGISEGNNAANPGPLDWSASLPVTIGSAGNQSLSLAAAAGSRPAIGTTFTMNVSAIPAGTAFGAMILSFTQTNIDLGPIGMLGCRQYVNLDATFLLLVTPPSASFGFVIQNNPAFIGIRMFGQAAMFAAGFNTLGVISSNGGDIRVGL